MTNIKNIVAFIKRDKMTLIYVAALLIATFIIAPPLIKDYPVPKGSADIQTNKAAADLQQEYLALGPFPGAVFETERTSIKPLSNVMFIAVFRASKEYSEVYRHFDKELKDNGWTFYKTSRYKIHIDGKAYDTHREVYKKGDYLCSFTQEPVTDRYHLTLGWRVDL